MVTIQTKGGARKRGCRCVSCSWGVVRKGYRAAEEEVFCRMLEPNVRVPYPVRECSEYSDRRIPSLYFMQKDRVGVAHKEGWQDDRLRDFRTVPED